LGFLKLMGFRSENSRDGSIPRLLIQRNFAIVLKGWVDRPYQAFIFTVDLDSIRSAVGGKIINPKLRTIAQKSLGIGCNIEISHLGLSNSTPF
ncbi:MAG: hypothetical protein ACM3YE_10900, partial [Bacteroidota bacterium]